MRTATKGQILHINRMYLDGGLNRARFDEVNRMAAKGWLTFDVAKAVTEGTFTFQNALTDAHLAKVYCVWETFGKKVFGVPFEKYLNGTDALEAIRPLPTWPDAWQTSFDRDVLVDGRVIDRIGFKGTCRLAGLVCYDENDTLVPYDPAVTASGVRWMRAQAGHKNRNRRPSDCRKSFADFEAGMDHVEGVFAYVNDPGVISGHYMDLVGSALRVRCGDYCRVSLGLLVGGPGFNWDPFVGPDPRFGAASRGKSQPSAT